MSHPPDTSALERTAAATMPLLLMTSGRESSRPRGLHRALDPHADGLLAALAVYRSDRPALGMRSLPCGLGECVECARDPVMKRLAHGLHPVVRRGTSRGARQAIDHGEREE